MMYYILHVYIAYLVWCKVLTKGSCSHKKTIMTIYYVRNLFTQSQLHYFVNYCFMCKCKLAMQQACYV